MRASCCYEVTDRNGPEGMRAGLAENERFLRVGRTRVRRCPRLLHPFRGHARGGGRPGCRPRPGRAHPCRGGPRRFGGRRTARGRDDRQLASCPLRAPGPSAARHGGSQPALEHEQRRRLRPPGASRQHGRARDRRHRRGHAGGVPHRLRPPPGGRRDGDARRGLVLAGERQGPRPRDRRGPGPVELRAHRPLASRLHAWSAAGRGRRGRRSRFPRRPDRRASMP